MRSRDIDDGAWGGIATFCSIIHIPRPDDVAVLREMKRVLQPGGLLFLAFDIGDDDLHMGEWWGQSVSVDFIYFRPDEMAGLLRSAGLCFWRLLSASHARRARPTRDDFWQIPPGTDVARMLKAVLTLLGIARGQKRKVAEIEDLSPAELEPLELSLSERALVEWKIFECIENPPSKYACHRDTVARVNALPLMFDWSGFMALRPDGQVVVVPYDDEPGPVQNVRDERMRDIGLFQGSKLHPELLFLAPRKPADAIECPDCGGTGKLAFGEGFEHFSERVICTCGGSGWLPRFTRLS